MAKLKSKERNERPTFVTYNISVKVETIKRVKSLRENRGQLCFQDVEFAKMKQTLLKLEWQIARSIV